MTVISSSYYLCYSLHKISVQGECKLPYLKLQINFDHYKKGDLINLLKRENSPHVQVEFREKCIQLYMESTNDVILVFFYNEKCLHYSLMKIYKHFMRHISSKKCILNSLFKELDVIKHAAHVTGKGMVSVCTSYWLELCLWYWNRWL